MPTHRYTALLRGINVGGHNVKMPALRCIFESAGFRNVETVIASGNVVFESLSGNTAELERTIEDRLAGELGYEVATFLRTIPELTLVAEEQPFDLARESADAVAYVIFLRDALEPAVREAVRSLDTDNDQTRIGRREVYWMRRERGKDSDVFGTRLNKILGPDTTARNINTVRRILTLVR